MTEPTEAAMVAGSLIKAMSVALADVEWVIRCTYEAKVISKIPFTSDTTS